MPTNRSMRSVTEISVVQALNTLTDGNCYITWQQNLVFQRKKITNCRHVFRIIVIKRHVWSSRKW